MTKAAIQELEWDWRFFYIRPTLRTLPHRITTSSALSQTICAEFPSNNDAELQNWLDEFIMAKPEDFFKHGSKTCPNVGRQS
jgi:hypothetical protein